MILLVGLLYIFVGYAALGGVFFMIFVLGITHYLGKKSERFVLQKSRAAEDYQQVCLYTVHILHFEVLIVSLLELKVY